MTAHLLMGLIAGAAGGLMLNILAAWLPARIAEADARWIALARGEQPATQVASSLVILRAYSWRAPGSIFLFLAPAVVGGLIAAHIGWSLKAMLLIALAWGLLVLAVIDLRTRLLPDALVMPLLGLGFLAQMSPLTRTVGLEASVLGAMLGYVLLLSVAWLFVRVRKVEGLGLGDVKLMAMIGAWVGPGALPTTLLIASLLGIAWQGAMIFSRKAGVRDEFAFGPWICLSALAAILISYRGI